MLSEADLDFLDRSLRLTREGFLNRLMGGRVMLGLGDLPPNARAVLAAELAAYEHLEALAAAALQAEGRERLELTAALIEGVLAMRGTAFRPELTNWPPGTHKGT